MYIGDWQWLDPANVPGALDWIAFVLGTLGIGFTVIQLVRSRGALNAARDALLDTQANLVRNQLLVVLPGFLELSKSIDRALKKNNRSDADDALGRFAVSAAEASVLLRASTPGFESLISDIDAAVVTAQAARASLFGNPTETVRDLIGPAANDLRLLIPTISGAALSIRNDPKVSINA